MKGEKCHPDGFSPPLGETGRGLLRFTLHVFLLPSGRLGGGFLHCFDFQRAVVGHFENFYAFAGWDRVAECESVYFMDRATDADLDFSLAFVVSWDAEINVCHLSLTLLDIESSVRL